MSNVVRSGMIKVGDDSNLLSLILLSGGESGGSSMLVLFFIGECDGMRISLAFVGHDIIFPLHDVYLFCA